MNDNDKNGFDDFSKRFEELADEAQKYGVNACVVLQTEDPISGTSRLAETLRGGRMRAIGMLQQALWHLQQKG
jgi:hypothetical protein